MLPDDKLYNTQTRAHEKLKELTRANKKNHETLETLGDLTIKKCQTYQFLLYQHYPHLWILPGWFSICIGKLG